MPAALVNGAGTADRVVYTTATPFLNLDPFTILMIINPTTLTNGRYLYSNGIIGVQETPSIVLSGGTGDIQMFVSRGAGATSTNYTTNSTPLSVTGTWMGLAVVFNSAAAAGEIINAYKGTPGIFGATECTYSSATDGSGALTTQAGSTAGWLNRKFLVTPDRAFQGLMSHDAIFNAALSAADVSSWFQRPRLTVGANTALDFARMGKDAADYVSYNTKPATVTGATQGNGPALFEYNPATDLYLPGNR